MSCRWLLSLLGLFLSTFALLALSGPGRIDIIDGQARYEVSRSLVEHGDVEVRDPDIWFPVAQGRDGKLFVAYRLPQPVLGIPALWLADLVGPSSEARRHFYFSLTSAFAGAALAVAYAIWFRRTGHSPTASLAWAAAGIFCTPNWYYATSTFDDILGAASVVIAIVTASRRTLVSAIVAGLWLGIAFNCKQPLGIFLLPTAATAFDSERPWRPQLCRLSVIAGGLVLGVVAYWLYEDHCFPLGLDKRTIPFSPPIWSASPLVTFAAQIASPSTGLIWYAPAVFVAVAGLTVFPNRLLAGATAFAALGLLGFLGLLSFGKGDIGWGPRYFTPAVAVLWLFAPTGTARLGAARAGIILALAAGVQLLALTVDPHRCYIRSGLQPKALLYAPEAHFDIRVGHLLQRPVELWEVLTSDATPQRFSPAPAPTYALPLPDTIVAEPENARRFDVFNSFRPWWCCQWRLSPDQRPVDIAGTAILLLVLAAAGAILAFGYSRPERPS